MNQFLRRLLLFVSFLSSEFMFSVLSTSNSIQFQILFKFSVGPMSIFEEASLVFLVEDIPVARGFSFGFGCEKGGGGSWLLMCGWKRGLGGRCECYG